MKFYQLVCNVTPAQSLIGHVITDIQYGSDEYLVLTTQTGSRFCIGGVSMNGTKKHALSKVYGYPDDLLNSLITVANPRRAVLEQDRDRFFAGDAGIYVRTYYLIRSLRGTVVFRWIGLEPPGSRARVEFAPISNDFQFPSLVREIPCAHGGGAGQAGLQE